LAYSSCSLSSEGTIVVVVVPPLLLLLLLSLLPLASSTELGCCSAATSPDHGACPLEESDQDDGDKNRVWKKKPEFFGVHEHVRRPGTPLLLLLPPQLELASPSMRGSTACCCQLLLLLQQQLFLASSALCTIPWADRIGDRH
jgi:hypothetical protein